MEKELRRNETALFITGTSVIGIGVWSVIKTLMFALLHTDAFVGTQLSELDSVERAAVWIGITVSLSLALLIRLYIGLSARAEVNGKKKGRAHLVLTVFLALLSLLSLISFGLNVYGEVAEEMTPDSVDQVASLILELTSLITLCELFISTVRIRRLRKALENGERHAE